MENCNIFSQEEILLINARGLFGYNIQELASSVLKFVPICLKYDKGYIGKLIEYILGSSIKNKVNVDFPKLNIELKTIPICIKSRKPIENTFICHVPLIKNTCLLWEDSYIYKKIKKILWVPIYCCSKISISDRIIGRSFIWTPNKFEKNLLKNDWEKFMDLIILGKIKNIKSNHGDVLQIKKKSKNKNSLTKYINEKGELSFTSPRAFYFKKKFTFSITNKYFV
ncbi:MAG: DNA mismatch repair endonuclease MutH [Buchnera aphidicola (Nurudea yanoniella)]